MGDKEEDVKKKEEAKEMKKEEQEMLEKEKKRKEKEIEEAKNTAEQMLAQGLKDKDEKDEKALENEKKRQEDEKKKEQENKDGDKSTSTSSLGGSGSTNNTYEYESSFAKELEHLNCNSPGNCRDVITDANKQNLKVTNQNVNTNVTGKTVTNVTEEFSEAEHSEPQDNPMLNNTALAEAHGEAVVHQAAHDVSLAQDEKDHLKVQEAVLNKIHDGVALHSTTEGAHAPITLTATQTSGVGQPVAQVHPVVQETHPVVEAHPVVAETHPVEAHPVVEAQPIVQVHPGVGVGIPVPPQPATNVVNLAVSQEQATQQAVAAKTDGAKKYMACITAGGPCPTQKKIMLKVHEETPTPVAPAIAAPVATHLPVETHVPVAAPVEHKPIISVRVNHMADTLLNGLVTSVKDDC